MTTVLERRRRDLRTTSLCGRDGRTICGPLCAPKSTRVSL